MDLPDQAKKRKTLTALSSHPSSTSSGGSAISSSTSPYFANAAPTSTATSAPRGRGGLALGLRRGLANTQQQQQQQQQPTAASPAQAAPTPAAAPPKPQSRPLALQQRQRQQPTHAHAQTQTQLQLQLQPQQRTPSPPQPKPPQPTRPAPAPTQPRQQPTLPPRTHQAPRGGGQEQEYRVPGLEAMRWMEEPPVAEPHARPTSTASQQKPVDIAFLVTPPTLNLLRCLQPEFVGPPVIHSSAMLSQDQVEELFGSLLRVLDDTRPTADVSDDDDEVVLWQARSLTAAEWKDGFAGPLRPLLCRAERVQALVAKCPSAALCRTLLHHYLPALLAGSSGAAQSTTTSSSSSSPPSSSLQGLLHSLLQGSGGFGDGGSPPDRLAGQLLPILSSFSCAHSSSAASATSKSAPPQKKPRTK